MLGKFFTTAKDFSSLIMPKRGIAKVGSDLTPLKSLIPQVDAFISILADIARSCETLITSWPP